VNNILLIEDEAKMAKLLINDLKLEGFTVEHANDGQAGLEKALGGSWALIILDVMLPKMDGYEVCRALRAQGSRTPILFLTARSQDTDKIVGFHVGADDYLTKPFNVLELIARVKALLRRSPSSPEETPDYRRGVWHIDFRRQVASKGKEPVALTTKEFQILRYLIARRDQVVSREEFLRELWQFEELPSTRTVDNQVASLRRKLGWDAKSAGHKIVTVHNAGYRFVD
jgi:DNA-binding response OmpR family regulator